jgi:hypothetical protein
MDEEHGLPRVWVSFDLLGASFDPDAITAQMGVEPTHAHRRGDPIREDKGRRRHDRWRVTAGPRETIEIGEMLSEVVERLAPASNVMNAVYATHDVKAMLTCAVEPRSALTPYVLFPVEIVQWAAQQGVAITTDLMLSQEHE